LLVAIAAAPVGSAPSDVQSDAESVAAPAPARPLTDTFVTRKL